MSEALRLAELIERDYHDETLAPRKAAAELRRLVAENEALKADTKSLATMSNLWAKEKALNAELVEALRGWMNQPENAATYDACMARAEAALAKVEASK